MDKEENNRLNQTNNNLGDNILNLIFKDASIRLINIPNAVTHINKLIGFS